MSTRTRNAVAKKVASKQSAAKPGNTKPATKRAAKTASVTMKQDRSSKRFIVFTADKLVNMLYVSKPVVELLSSAQKQVDLTFDSPSITKGGKLGFSEVGDDNATCGLYLVPADAARLGISETSKSVKARLSLDGKNVKLTVIA